VARHDDERWNEVRFDLVVSDNIAKFGQNPAPARTLAGLRRRDSCQGGTPRSNLGIGIGRDNPASANPLGGADQESAATESCDATPGH